VSRLEIQSDRKAIGLAHFVAADFNPLIRIPIALLSAVGTIHLKIRSIQ